MTFRPRYYRYSKWILFWADSPGMYNVQYWLVQRSIVRRFLQI